MHIETFAIREKQGRVKNLSHSQKIHPLIELKTPWQATGYQPMTIPILP
jgi:hypothetical protein